MPEPGKSRARLFLSLLLASCLVLIPLLMTWWESRLPVYEFGGVITGVEIGIGRNYNAQLSIATAPGGRISVHVSDPNTGWRAGQRLTGRYYGGSGELIRATLLSADGKPERIVQRSAGFRRTCAVLLGLAVAWLAISRYRKNPTRMAGRAAG